MSEFKKRIITSIFLFILLIFMYLYNFILIIFLIIISLIVWIEFLGLISKIFNKNNFKSKIFRLTFKSLSLIYLFLLTFVILIIFATDNDREFFVIFSLFISIASDIGGIVFGKFFKGRKLTKISPKKTISGSVGAFLFSISLIFFYDQNFEEYSYITLLLIIISISLISQIGDLFISYLKRKAKVKNTSNILPGHGGLLDRVDGIIFAVPFGIFLSNFSI